MTLNVSCPTCDQEVLWQVQSQFRPFCSKRCQLIDLGEWAEESHKISQSQQSHIPLSEEMLDALDEEFSVNTNFFVDAE